MNIETAHIIYPKNTIKMLSELEISTVFITFPNLEDGNGYQYILVSRTLLDDGIYKHNPYFECKLLCLGVSPYLKTIKTMNIPVIVEMSFVPEDKNKSSEIRK